MRRGIPGHVAPLLAVFGLAPLASAQTALPRVVSTETAPAGAWARIKASLAAPQHVTAGYLSIEFDPRVFGPVGNTAVFSATGDAVGFAQVNGNHVDATFSNQYKMVSGAATFQVGESISVQSVSPAGGLMPVRREP